MMQSVRSSILIPLMLAGISVPGPGCSHGDRRPGEHASARLLKSESGPRLTSRQAADIQFAMGRSLEDAGNAGGAEAAYRRAIENDPRRADAHARLGIMLGLAGRFDESNTHLADAVKIDPENPEALCDQGYGFYVQRRWAEAEACFRRAIELSPTHARSHTNLGLVFARQGDEQGALAQFERGGCTPSDARANLGLILAMDGNLSDAEESYRAALAAGPGSKTAASGLGAVVAARESGTAVATSKTLMEDSEVQRTSLKSHEKPGR